MESCLFWEADFQSETRPEKCSKIITNGLPISAKISPYNSQLELFLYEESTLFSIYRN